MDRTVLDPITAWGWRDIW